MNVIVANSNLFSLSQVKDEWRYAALVVDRVLLWIYVAVCFVGGLGILMNAPVLYDDRQPLK